MIGLNMRSLIDLYKHHNHFALFLGLALLSGCAAHAPARYGGSRQSILHLDNHYKLAVVEFGGFGSYLDPTMTEVSNAVKLLDATQRPLLVIYIHGWHNDVRSPDLNRFSGFLNRIALSRQVISSQLNVVGVYFGWPGESLRIPVLNTFTFWDRKRAAERIANNDDCLDAIEQLSHAARLHSQSYTILMGHSFGGLIVERTVAHTMRTLQGQKGVAPPWDLALILNPASDSVLARQVVVSLEALYKYDAKRGYVPRNGGQAIAENQPTIVELQADNDSATRLTFPVGSSLSSIMGFHWGWNKVAIPGIRADGTPRGSISEREFYLSTPGNNRYLINYVIVPSTAAIPSYSSDAFDFNLLHNPENRVFYTSSEKDSESAARTLSSGAASPVTPTSQWRAWQIAYAADVDAKDYPDNARVPFWIVRVPSQIIDNHGGIWSDNNMALMAAIFRLHRPLVTKQVIVSGQRKTERMVPVPAKPYILPARSYFEQQETQIDKLVEFQLWTARHARPARPINLR
jgi:hypothetical protein